MLSHDEIARIADQVFRSALGSAGFERSAVADDVDPDGERAVLVTLRFKPGSEPADGKASVAAHTELHDALRTRGEERFPYLRFEFPDDDVPAAVPEDFEF